MRISTSGIQLIACGALVAAGVMIGSGSAHALANPRAGQPAGSVDVGECVLGHNTVTGDHCYTEGYSDPKDRPAGYPTPDPTPNPDADCRDILDYDGDYDCTQKPSDIVTGGSSGEPVVVTVPVAVTVPTAVGGVTVSNAAPVAAATPAKAPTVSTPALAAAASPAATTSVKALPATGGEISGIVLLAIASLGAGGALRRFDKRRRLAA
jgi:hypothetical protein